MCPGLGTPGHYCLRFLQERLDFLRRGFEQGRTSRRIEKDVQVADVILLGGPYAYVPLADRALQTIGQKISPNCRRSLNGDPLSVDEK
jgi:hypothetical protein